MSAPRPAIPYTRMTVAGIMSGTSADGVDVALLKMGPRAGSLAFRLIGFSSFPFSSGLRRAILNAMNSPAIEVAELARLHWRLGLAYAEALTGALRRIPCRLDLIGCHGQTIYHQGRPRRYLGRNFSCTWQIGETAPLARAGGAPVVSNFRPADMAAGGQGAPLVPLFDWLFFTHPKRGRVLQNLGGIGNLTALPPAAAAEQALAFDTGPANMVVDALMQRLFGKKFDRGGATASRGKILDNVVDAALRHPFFRQPPPKSAGREQFGEAYTRRFYDLCHACGGQPEDAIASATALAARSIALAYSSFVRERMGEAKVDLIVSGGGSRNRTLLEMLRRELAPFGCNLKISSDLGLPSQAKEAAAFALLAYRSWHGAAGNLPGATGATVPVVLGQIANPRLPSKLADLATAKE